MDPLHPRKDPQKSMVEKVLVDGAPAEHAEYWKAPEIV